MIPTATPLPRFILAAALLVLLGLLFAADRASAGFISSLPAGGARPADLTPSATPTSTPAPTYTPVPTSTAHPAITGSPSATPPCTQEPSPQWHIIPSQHPGIIPELNSLSAVSADDIWAVGSYGERTGPNQAVEYTLVEHWDGRFWDMVPSPNAGSLRNNLQGVKALSATDVWAVGFYQDGPGGFQRTLILHWDGVAWSVIPSPSVESADNMLLAIATVSPADIWAVGTVTVRETTTLAEHWDGTQWRIVPSPNVGVQSRLYSVAAVASNDVWAVGTYHPGSNGQKTLALHWDGTAWNVVPTPNLNALANNSLGGVTALASDNVWAAGDYQDPLGLGYKTMFQHWNGTSWSVVPSPNNSEENFLSSIVARSPTDIWAVGTQYTGFDPEQPLAEHWDGAQWSVVQTPNGVPNHIYLRFVEPLGAEDVWVAGNSSATSGQYTGPLALHYFRDCLAVAPTPTAKATGTSTPTDTPQPPRLLVGHVTWQGPPAQPDARQQLPLVLALCVSGTPVTYTATTDASGYFTITDAIAPGSYNWSVKGPKYLATSGTLIAGPGTIQVEMGVMSAGDTNNTHDNIVNVADFDTMKGAFGTAGTAGDLNNDGQTTVIDFGFLKVNFGHAGRNLTCP